MEIIEKIKGKVETDEEPSYILESAQDLDIPEVRQEVLVKEIFKEFDVIKAERMAEHYDYFIKTAENQYKGEMPRRKNAMFNLNEPITKTIIKDIVGDIVDSHWGVDPIVSISPRPEFAKEGGSEVCQKQEQFIDCVMDVRIPFKSRFELASQSACLKKVGMIKWFHKIRKEKRVGKETYVGKNEVIGKNENGSPVIDNAGVKNFMLQHGKEMEKAPEKYKKYIEDLIAEKTIQIEVTRDELTYNDPYPKFVDNKNFYVHNSVSGYEGLCETRCIIERVNFSYYELKKFEKENKFVNIDKLVQDDNGNIPEGAYSRDFDILECVFYFLLNDDDEDYTKIVCWISEEKRIYLGGVYFPFTVLDCYYVPHYVTEGEGFYHESIAEDIKDINVAKNAILNLTLESAYIATLITPIVPPGSKVIEQFLNKEFTVGIPIEANPNEIAFLNERMRPPDIGGLLLLNHELSKISGDVTGRSDLRTGRESPLDPNAPGNKTIALLQQTSKNIRRYVMKMSEGFNQDINCILKIYYEISQEAQEYFSSRASAVVGENPFKISRSEMIARTTIQSQAYAFDFDKQNEKRANLALYQVTQNEMLIQGNPEAKYHMIKTLIKSWSPMWSKMIDKILPSLEEFRAGQAKLALQATVQYFKGVADQAQVTGQVPKLDPNQLLAMIQDLQARSVSTVAAETQRQKQEQKG